MQNRVCQLFGIKYPIIQAGMIWCSGWELASAVSNAGGLGIIGSGSMYPNILEDHIVKCKNATNKPFAVNIPLLYPDIEQHVATIIRHQVPIVFSSAGNPGKYTPQLKEAGIKVVHVVSNLKFALKACQAGVDALVAEGFEAGGHNGREETTTLCLVPLLRNQIDVPLIAAGGIATGRSMAAALALGADGVQIGSRFVLSQESSAHANFKDAIVSAKDGDTRLSLKSVTPVRLLKNTFAEEIIKAELEGKSRDDLIELLGRGRSKKGMFEGDLEQGELEIGQVSAFINQIKPARDIVEEIIQEYNQTIDEISKERF